MGIGRSVRSAAAGRRFTRAQDEHPLMGGEAGDESAEDHVLRLIHLKAYVDGALRGDARSVLDIGCNDGYGTVLLAATARRIVGIDVSKAAIARARERPEAKAIDFRVADGDHLPFPDQSFDLVTAFQVIEHISDIDPFLAETRRVTTPGGTIVFTTPNAAVRLDPGMPPWNPFHVREYTGDQLQEALARTFPDVHVRGLFAPAAVAEIELARTARSRQRARHPRPRLVRTALELLPDPVRARIRRLTDRSTGVDRSDVRRYKADDLWYADEDLDTAIDLQAICRPGSV